MNRDSRQKQGRIVWHDLTVPNAAELSSFYSQVCGWEATAREEHGGDFVMNVAESDSASEAIAGVCYAKGSNANVPPQWLLYVEVPDVQERAKQALELGGKCVDGPRKMGEFHFCVIQDPAGAYIALIGPLPAPAKNGE